MAEPPIRHYCRFPNADSKQCRFELKMAHNLYGKGIKTDQFHEIILNILRTQIGCD